MMKRIDVPTSMKVAPVAAFDMLLIFLLSDACLAISNFEIIAVLKMTIKLIGM